jgi:integrase
MAHEAKAKSITEAQFNIFMQAVRDVESRYDSDYVKFWENIFYCASELGLRSIETCRIKVEHIDFFEKTLLLPEQKNKEKFEKIVIPDFMLERFKDHILTYKSEIVLSDNYLFWRQRYGRRSRCGRPSITGKYSAAGEKHLSPGTIRSRIVRIRKAAGLDHKYATSKTGHKLSVLSYHTLRHYYLQKICDKRGVFAAQICGRHKNLRSTERYIKTSMRAKRDIVNSVFNTVEEKQNQEISDLKEQIQQLTKLVKVVVTPQAEACTPVTDKIAEEEAIAMMKNQIFMKHNPKQTVD